MSTKSLSRQEYTIQEIARLTGLPESTLRYYETIGLIDSIDRDESSKHRRYSEDDLNVITSIACLNATGMSLDDMRKYIANRNGGSKAAVQQVQLLTDQGKRLMAEERQLKVRQQYVDLKIKYWQAIVAGEKSKAEAIAKKASVLAKELTHKK
jgi:DNA-binding transcriptional MerR regulator